MATYGWGSNRPVADWLFAEPYRFEFHQAVRLLEMLRPRAAPVGEGAEPEREAVRLRSEIGLEFPASEVLSAARGGAGAPAELTARFLGLAGALGPLPKPYSELIIERMARGDTAARDFLDIFHHRLLSLLHRLRGRFRLGVGVVPPGQDALARYLFHLTGLGLDSLRKRMQIDDRAVLSSAGLIAQQPRSAIGLRLVLEEYFGVPVRVGQFVGRWYPIEADHHTILGRNGQNQVLGRSALCGTRLWERAESIEVALGPLDYRRFSSFLPSGDAFIPLCELTQFYLGNRHDVDYRLILAEREVPETRIAAGAAAPRLGWTTWLHSRPVAGEKTIRLSGRQLTAELRQLRVPLFHDMTVDELVAVRAKMKPLHFAENRVVIREGDAGSSLFVMQRGKAKVIGRGSGTNEVLLATIEDGELFGEMSLVSGRPRTATVVTLEPCEILELSWDALQTVIQRYPRVASVLESYYRRRLEVPAEGENEV
jgi:type VI secretion system protein ImpH